MTGNEAVRARIAMAMASHGSAIRISDVLVIAVIRQVRSAIGMEKADDSGEVSTAVRKMEEQLEASRELIVRQTAQIARRMAALDAVAAAADGYRRAVDKGSGKRAAREKLFDALAALEAIALAGGGSARQPR
jgi:hypothetical protein